MEMPDLNSRTDGPLLLAVSLTFVASAYFAFLNQGLWWDEAVYIGLAKGILNGHYSVEPGTVIETFRPPVLPAALALANAVTPQAARLVVLAFGWGAMGVTYLAGKRMYGRTEGLIAAVVMAAASRYMYFQSKILSEAVFAFFLAASLYLLIRHEDGVGYPFMAGIATGLAFMTRYPGGILFPLYGGWLLWKSDLKNAIYFSIGSMTALIPIVLLGISYYGDPLALPLTSFGVFTGIQSQPWHFYITNLPAIFGPLGLVVLAGVVQAARKKEVSLSLITGVVIFMMFSALPHKEVRFLIPFFPVFGLLAARSWDILPDMERREYMALAIVLLTFASLFQAHMHVHRDRDGGKALVQASELLNTLPEGPVLSEYYGHNYPADLTNPVNNPWLRILTGREVLIFPQDPAELSGTRAEYAVIYDYSPKVPEYAAEYAAENWERMESFQQWGNADSVIVYRVT